MKLSSLLQRGLVAVVFGILCLSQSFDVEAQQKRKPERQERREGGREERERFAEDSGQMINWRELNLSQEQKEQLRNLRRDFQVATADIRKELAFAEEGLQMEIRRENVDREKVARLVQDISGLKQRVSDAATENVLALKAILTQEQRGQLAASQQALPKELGALGLTESQQVQIQKLLKSSFRHNRKLTNELRELRSDLRDLLLSPNEPDSTQLKKVQAQIAAKELTLERAKVDKLLAIRELLSPEQRKLLK